MSTPAQQQRVMSSAAALYRWLFPRHSAHTINMSQHNFNNQNDEYLGWGQCDCGEGLYVRQPVTYLIAALDSLEPTGSAALDPGNVRVDRRRAGQCLECGDAGEKRPGPSWWCSRGHGMMY